MRPVTELPAGLLARAAGQCGLVSAGDCHEFAISTARRRVLCERRTWRRLTTRVYDTRPGRLRALSFEERARRGAWLGMLAYGPDARAVGTSALALLGVQGLPAVPTPEVALADGRSVRSRDGITVRQLDADMRLVRACGRWVAAPEWALAQAVPLLDRDHAVAVMDSIQHLGRLDPDGFACARELTRGRRGAARTHGWWALSDGRAESPLETFGRLDCHDVGVPPDDLQVEIFSELGVLLGRGDTGWRQANGRWLIGELDGRGVHELPAALLHDRSRQNDFLLDGDADVLRFTWRDIGPHHRMGRTVQRFLARSGRWPDRGGSHRS